MIKIKFSIFVQEKRVKNLAVKLQLFEATRLASFFVDTLPSHFSGSSTSRMADVLHTKKTTQSWFLPFPKNKSEARQLFGTTIVWHMYVQSWQQQLLSQELRSACYRILFLSLHFRFWCYHLLSESLGALKCARHDAVQTHHLLVLREDVETRTHPELLSSPEMPRLDAMRQRSESPKRHCAFGTLAFERLPQMSNEKYGPLGV